MWPEGHHSGDIEGDKKSTNDTENKGDEIAVQDEDWSSKVEENWIEDEAENDLEDEGDENLEGEAEKDLEDEGYKNWEDEEVFSPTLRAGRLADKPITRPEGPSWKYYEDTNYYMIFGIRSSGKTVALSGLMYCLNTFQNSSVENLNNRTVPAELKGEKLYETLLSNIPDGRWFPGSPTISADDLDVPRQIHLKFKPNSPSKPEFTFCTMDMAGEDLMRMRVSENHQVGLHPGIEEIFKIPKDYMSFICVYPAVDEEMQRSEKSSYMRSFFNILDQYEHRETPLIMLISKWDIVEDQYKDAEDFLRRNDEVIWSRLQDSDRKVSYMKFSIGTEDSGGFKYDRQDSEKLLSWMYETAHGIPLKEPARLPWWKSLFSLFKRKV